MKMTNSEKEFNKLRAIEKKIGIEDLTSEEIELLQKQAVIGAPRFEFDYGVFLLLTLGSKELAMPWFEKFFKHANGEMLFRAGMSFTDLVKQTGDKSWSEWAYKCLRRSAWRQFPLAKAMIKEIDKYLINHLDA